jgi:DNA-binding response OmpR family regulator
MLVVMMIEDMLADLGCKLVTSAATVDQALALINAQVFDAAMLDVNLNGNDSHPVAEALSARGVPFIYSIGGYSDRPVLRKPFKYEELVHDVCSPQARADRGIAQYLFIRRRRVRSVEAAVSSRKTAHETR